MGNVVPFRRPARRQRSGAVSLVTDHMELGLTPAEARELAHDLLELADDAEARGAQ